MKSRTCSSTERHRLEMQGYVGYTDQELGGFGSWTRLAPAVCATAGLVGLMLGSPAIFVGITIAATLGMTLPLHPIDWLYNRTISPIFGTARLPHHGLPRRSACFIATIWILGVLWAYSADAVVVAQILAALFVIIAAIPALIGFCVPSFFYRLIERTIARKKEPTQPIRQ